MNTPPPPPPLSKGDETRRDQRHFPCPNCGADLRFDPGAAAMVCTHCEAEVEVPHVDDEAAQVEHDLLEHIRKGLDFETVETPSLNCETCGASIEFDADEHSRLCPFCDSAIVADVTLQRHIVPQGLLPFAVREKQAHEVMHKWLKARWFAPSHISSAAAVEHFAGVYVPTWTYDAYSVTDYTGKRGRRVGSGKNRRMVWTKVSGTVSGAFDDVLVSGSQSVSAEFKDALTPWPLGNLETYQTEFLAGFRAENHTVGLEDGYLEGQEFMRVKIRDWIKADIGGDAQKITSSTSTFSKQSFKHLLLPVWITHYSLEGRRYRMSVNGQTGKVYGQRPFSTKKLLAGALAAFVAFLLLGALVSLSFGPKMRTDHPPANAQATSWFKPDN